jgi:hypothetical protein
VHRRRAGDRVLQTSRERGLPARAAAIDRYNRRSPCWSANVVEDELDEIGQFDDLPRT